MKQVTDLIVAKDVSSGEGFIDIVKQDGQTELVAGETMADSPIIYIQQELASSAKRLSKPIKGASVKRYTGQSGVAETVQVTTVDPVSVSNSTTYLFRIIPTSGDQQHQIRKSYEFTTDASATATELVTGLKALINADNTIAVTATGSSTLILTSDAAIAITNNSSRADATAVRFDVALDDGWASTATTTATATPDQGSGTFQMLRLLEWEVKGYEGHLNRVMFTDSPDFYTVSGGLYDIYAIEHGNPLEVGPGISESLTITYIAVIAGSSTFLQGAFETLLNDYMASTPGAFNAIAL